MGAFGRSEMARACLRSPSFRLYQRTPSSREPSGRPDTRDASSYNPGSVFTYAATYDTGEAPPYWVDVEVTSISVLAQPTAPSSGFLAFFS